MWASKNTLTLLRQTLLAMFETAKFSDYLSLNEKHMRFSNRHFSIPAIFKAPLYSLSLFGIMVNIEEKSRAINF